jgi:hypothetical protein
MTGDNGPPGNWQIRQARLACGRVPEGVDASRRLNGGARPTEI